MTKSKSKRMTKSKSKSRGNGKNRRYDMQLIRRQQALGLAALVVEEKFERWSRFGLVKTEEQKSHYHELVTAFYELRKMREELTNG